MLISTCYHGDNRQIYLLVRTGCFQSSYLYTRILYSRFSWFWRLQKTPGQTYRTHRNGKAYWYMAKLPFLPIVAEHLPTWIIPALKTIIYHMPTWIIPALKIIYYMATLIIPALKTIIYHIMPTWIINRTPKREGRGLTLTGIDTVTMMVGRGGQFPLSKMH